MTVRFDSEDGVATATIDRPDRLNALDSATLSALADALDEAREADADVLVLRGAGDEAFAAGADVREFREMDVADADAYVELAQRVTRGLLDFPVPVIAAIDGYCLGGGWELALCCDLRVASERAVVGHTEIDLALVPTWGGVGRLVRLVDDETARRLLYFGERVDAQDAYEMGLVGDVVAHDQLSSHVSDLAADLAAKPSFALRATKEAVTRASAGDREAELAYERRLMGALFGSDDVDDALRAFFDE